MKERLALLLIAVVSVAVVAVVGFLLRGGPGEAPAGGMLALPAINAALNATSALLLVAGYGFIRRRRVVAHFRCMVGAFAVSLLFLVMYVIDHAQVGSRPFPGQGAVRWIYFPILISHIVLAASIVPLALLTLYRAGNREFARHRRIARWTWPIWLYVSVSGVVVYWMLHHLVPGS